MKFEIDLPEHQYNNIIAFSSINIGRVPYKGIIMYAINAIKNATPVDQDPNVRHCFGCKYSKDNHNAGTEECHLCMWENQYTPTTKNDLEVDCIDRNSIKYYPGTGGYMYASKGEIDKLPSVTPQEPRWIPVSEYLPVTNDEVLVTYIVNGNAKKRYVETANCFDGEWSSVNDEYRIPNTKIEIIAWCEMPKPYKAEVESQESEGT